MKYKEQIKRIIKGTNITLSDVIAHAISNSESNKEYENYLIWSALDLIRDELRDVIESLEVDGETLSYWYESNEIKPKTIKKMIKKLSCQK